VANAGVGTKEASGVVGSEVRTLRPWRLLHQPRAG
jgi:hypothetical protein